MALSLSNLVRRRSDKPPRIVIYGVPGIGKTSLAAEFPDPIFIQTEEGAGNLELTTFAAEPFTTFGQIDEAIELLLTGDHEFRTVVVDSLDWLEPIVWAETCRGNKWQSIEEPGFGKGYAIADVTWRYLLGRLGMLRDQRGMTLILLAHEEVKTFADPERDSYDRYRLRLHKRAAEMVVENADVVGFMNYVTTIKREKSGFGKETAKASSAGQRVLHLTERPAFTAKNRFDLPELGSDQPRRGLRGAGEVSARSPPCGGRRRRLRRTYMANLGGTFDATAVEPASGRTALPAGEYLAAIAKSSVGPTKSGSGTKAELEFEVLDGPHKGRRFWVTLNLKNPNAQAQEIGLRELSAICHAVGKLRVADTEELHAHPMLVKLGIDKNDPERNVAKGYRPATAATPTSPGPGTGAAGAAKSRGPWA